MTIYLGENLISGQATLVGESRNIGQIIPSTIPLTDAGLHLLDGSLINGSGIYSAFVDYMGDLYDTTAKTYKSSVFTVVGSPTITSDGIASGFSNTNCLKINSWLPSTYSSFDMYLGKIKVSSTTTQAQWLFFGQKVLNSICSGFILAINTNKKTRWFAGSGAANWDIATAMIGSIEYNANDSIEFRLVYNGTKYTLYSRVNNGSWQVDSYATSSLKIDYDIPDIYIGSPNTSSNAYVLGTIDLKDFSISVDDKQVLSGSNRTGFCLESEWQQSVTNYGVCGKFVYEPSSNTVRLPKLYSEDRYLIDSYASGANWYRIYSDGWCEQGSYVSSIPSDSYATVYFLKPFINTNYFFTNQIQSAYAIGTGWDSGCADEVYTSRTVNSTVVTGDGISTTKTHYGFFWQACGYINISDYIVAEKYEYIVLATSTKTDIQVDIDEIATDLNGKVDKSSLSEVYPVVETYVNGTSWYRIYSDGWCEQGSKIVGGTDGMSAVAFLQTYISEPQIYIQRIWRPGGDAGGTGVDRRQVTISDPSTSGFNAWTNGWSSIDIYWEAKGYIN